MRLISGWARFKGMTLVEMLVVAVIIAILSGMLLTVAMKSRHLVHASQCMSNQRQIGLALQLYWDSHACLPDDNIANCLKAGLSPLVGDAGLFCCPAYRPPAEDSYSSWYVRRSGLQNNGEYIAGCFRHPDRTPILYSDMHIAFGQAEKMICKGIPVSSGAPPAERTVANGQISFCDGSRVKIKKHNANFQLEGIASFRQANGVLCSLVRLRGVGEVDIDVTPGSGFEAITPPLVARVHGTSFEIETEENIHDFAAEVKVSSGHVEVCERREDSARGRGQVLAPGQSKKISSPKKK